MKDGEGSCKERCRGGVSLERGVCGRGGWCRVRMEEDVWEVRGKRVGRINEVWVREDRGW